MTAQGSSLSLAPKTDDAPDAIIAPIEKIVHNIDMRANVNLDTDAYHFARAYASAKGLPLGAAISELLRRAEQMAEPSEPSKLTTSSRGYLVIAKTGKVVTPEMVKEASEDDLG